MNLIPFLLVLFLSTTASVVSAKISCRDEMNQPTDWYVISKLPRDEVRYPRSFLGRGESYVYLNVSTSGGTWMESEKSIRLQDSILGNTLKGFYGNKKDLTYLLYNDETAQDRCQLFSTFGHTKGVVVFDKDTGFWLVHSVPKFPPSSAYEYPESGTEFGQSALCITFRTKELNEIGKQLLYNHPNIYSKGYENTTFQNLDDDVKSLFDEKPKFVKKAPFSRISSLKSAGNMTFVSLAKDNEFHKDLYDELVAPELKTSLFVQTWRRGSGTPLPPSCQIQYKVEDVTLMNMTIFQKEKDRTISFDSMNDHSKWAVSSGSGAQWVCIGDINRMESQFKRGGGTVCFESPAAWKAYSSMVAGSDHC